MTDETKSGGALVTRGAVEEAFARLTSSNIKTGAELAARIREVQDHAFVLSPTALGGIAPGYEIVPVVVVIDPSVDPDSGRGADVYHQPAIHKSHKIGPNKWEPVEVSLNAQALGRIMGAIGINPHPPRWAHDGVTERYLWVCESDGHLMDFTGQVRLLPAGIGSLDARDGAADIGEWTAEEWARRVDVAALQRAKTPKEEQWKVKPEPINGWTYERVLQVRKFGRQLALTKSLNGMVRKVGVKQTYTIAELRAKPFVVLRPMPMFDMTDPEIRRMVAAANLGATHVLYGTPPVAAPVSHAAGDPTGTMDGEVVPPPEAARPAAPPDTAAPPEDVEAFTEAPPPPADNVYVITKVTKRGKAPDLQYFIQAVHTADQKPVTFFSTDVAVAKACHSAALDGQPREIDAEPVSVRDQRYLAILNLAPAGGLKL